MAECVPNRKLIAELMEKEEKSLENETPKSYELYQRAVKHMPMGVASTYHARDPYPVYFTHGKGPHIWSVEGKEIVDFHNGYGCMVQGHAHPLIVEAIQKRAPLGTQFGLPTEDAIIMAENLAGAFKLPQWRFVNSGSEATMDAIRVARAFTGREHHRQDVRLVPRPSRLRHGQHRRRSTTARSARATTTPRSPTAAASRRPRST